MIMPRLSASFRVLTLLAALGASALAWAQSMPLATLTLGMYRIEAEVAATFADRQRGLMHRSALPAQRGMIFVFPDVATHCMWMKNTPLPLSVAFLDQQGRILNIAEMQPNTETSHCAAAPARYALEMNAGWFASKGLGPGLQIQGLERLPAAH